MVPLDDKNKGNDLTTHLRQTTAGVCSCVNNRAPSHCVAGDTIRNTSDTLTLSWWRRKQRCSSSVHGVWRACDYHKTSFYQYTWMHRDGGRRGAGCLWVNLISCTGWIRLVFVCALERERKGVLESPLECHSAKSVAFDYCCLCCATALCCAVLSHAELCFW